MTPTTSPRSEQKMDCDLDRVLATADFCPHGGSSSLCEWCGYKARIPQLLAMIEEKQERLDHYKGMNRLAVEKLRVAVEALEWYAAGGPCYSVHSKTNEPTFSVHEAKRAKDTLAKIRCINE